MKKIIAIVLIGIFCPKMQGQKDGYWDKDRAISQELVVSAGQRVVFKADDFPIGTTELVYRITLLDDNQQLASSLVSLLKSIPDPTGISQGSAGAVFLMSKISGQDKCKYAIFSTNELAAAYQKTGKTTQACFDQQSAVSKEAKRLSLAKSSCLRTIENGLYFGFQSSNWIMKQKIVLEIVPWIDYKLNSGWTLENRKTIINQCKTSALAREMANSDDFCICVEEKIQKKFKFQEFQKLLQIEQTKYYKDFGVICFEETGGSKALIDGYRASAAKFEKRADYSNAIAQYNLIVADGKAVASDYSALGYNLVLTKQFDKAIKFLKLGEDLDKTDLIIKLNLAHAYLLNNDFRSAKNIYKQFQGQNVSDTLSWVEKMNQDFELFKTTGVESEDFDKITKLMK